MGLAVYLYQNETRTKRTTCCLLMLVCTLFGVCSQGAEEDPSLSPELVDAYNAVKNSEKANQFDMGKVTPGDLKAGQDSNTAVSKVADKSLQYWWENSGAKQSPLGTSVDSAQKSMQKDVVLSPDAAGKQQKINMGVDLFQSTARVKYEGFANAEVFYKMTDSSAGVQLSKKLDSSKDVTLGETMRSSDSSSEVKFRWSW